MQFTTTVVLFATLVAIIIYTWKTWQLKDLTSKQITYNIRPLIILEPKNLIVKNIGNGIALDISIDKIAIKDCDGPFIKNIKKDGYVVFDSIGCLDKNSSFQGIKFLVLDANGNEIPIDTAFHNSIYDINNTMSHFEICIRYKDIEGTEYRTHMKVKNGIFQLIGIG